MTFSTDGSQAYFLHDKTFWNSTLSLYSTAGWELLRERKVTDYTLELAINRNDNILIASTQNKLIKTMDPHSLEVLHVEWELEALDNLIFHPVSPTIYAGITSEKGIQVRDLATGEVMLSLPPMVIPFADIHFTKDGSYLLAFNVAGQLLAWNLENNEIGYTIDILGHWVAEGKNDVKIIHDESIFGLTDAASIHQLSRKSINMTHPDFVVSSKKKNRIAPLPIVGYSAETRLFLGLTLDIVLDNPNHITPTSRFSRPSTVMPIFFYGFSGIWSAGVKSEFYHIDKWYFYNHLNYVRNNQSAYFGMRNQVTDIDAIRYSNNLANWQGAVSKLIMDQFLVGLRYEIRKESPLQLRDTPNSPIRDLEGGFMAGIGPVVRWDTRNSIIFPSSGQSLEVSYMHYGNWLGADYSFNSFMLDFRQYVPLSGISSGSALALQLHYHNVYGGETPFFMLPYLGGDRLIRGAWRNLYLEKQSIMLQTELRSDFSRADPRYGYVVFAGIGDVAANFFRSYNPEIIGVGGVGLRQQLVPKLKLQSRLDFSYSTRGDWGILGGIGVSF
ncbi:BamA/TamA family outer membrane protein [Pontibacter sp. 13R65]|uniref:BamA/TamA family outer membrane protein n=1 Tax=Pontibacter sp. 13R65 TaxID=3127458 RepID=UPI00301E1B2F